MADHLIDRAKLLAERHIGRGTEKMLAAATVPGIVRRRQVTVFTLLGDPGIMISKVSEEVPEMTARVKVSNKNQIAVPSEVRKRLGIKGGDRLLVDIREGYFILMPEPAEYSGRLRRLNEQTGQAEDAQEYVDRERDAWER